MFVFTLSFPVIDDGIPLTNLHVQRLAVFLDRPGFPWKKLILGFSLGQYALEGLLLLRQYQVLQKKKPPKTLEDEISQEVFDKSQVRYPGTPITQVLILTFTGIWPCKSQVRLLVRPLLADPKCPLHPVRHLTPALVVNRFLAGPLPARTLLGRDITIGTLLLHLHSHLADLVPANILLQHVRPGRKVRVQQADPQAMGYGYAQGAGVDGRVGNASAQCVPQDHPGHWDKILLLPVALRDCGPTLCHHHLSHLHPPAIQ